jgi:hypothetical protein
LIFFASTKNLSYNLYQYPVHIRVDDLEGLNGIVFGDGWNIVGRHDNRQDNGAINRTLDIIEVVEGWWGVFGEGGKVIFSC